MTIRDILNFLLYVYLVGYVFCFLLLLFGLQYDNSNKNITVGLDDETQRLQDRFKIQNTSVLFTLLLAALLWPLLLGKATMSFKWRKK